MINDDSIKFSSTISPDSYLFSADPSIGGKNLQKFKRGQFSIAATLDLHGYTLDQAQDVLDTFVQDSLEQQLRYLLIIHGKGTRAILKNHVNDYLADQPQVLAFCSAKPKDGGFGAVYVLLKKQKIRGVADEEE
jgi:DNA-nicking Smr family endonuclease